ncbi:hypothetical protein AX17_004061 [Amanita inopinata Kibby_2008]|nr:hypothetical protein AX17_004061 [Amanita inopinata Kibby_2008]
MFSSRKSSYKLPPTTIRDTLITQEARRSKARCSPLQWLCATGTKASACSVASLTRTLLSDGVQRRAQKFDSSRQLDVFADLTLNGSDEDEEEEDDKAESAMAPSTGIGSFVSAMKQSVSQFQQQQQEQVPSTSSMACQVTGAHKEGEPTSPTKEHARKKQHQKKKRRGGRNSAKPSKWADKCMYAELLEMVDPGLSQLDGWESDLGREDGLPKDLETGWVAVAPVPVGKRCLAVTYQSSGVVGVAPNTTLRSRLLGKALITRFPSALPPLTILDCILDVNWKDNGILHVLDVIKWKGQDVGDCEAPFRFWWRDTRLAEMAQSAPSASGYQSTIPIPMVSVPSRPSPDTSHSVPGKASALASSSKYQFSYPTTFLPIPYHTDTSLTTLRERIIPCTRSMRCVTVNVPVFNPRAVEGGNVTNEGTTEGGGMDIDVAHANANGLSAQRHSHVSGSGSARQVQMPTQQTFSFSFAHETHVAHAHGRDTSKAAASESVVGKDCVAPTPTVAAAVASVPMKAHIQSDGLLLYVAEASYEAGTSPLSSWIPIVGYEKHKGGKAEIAEGGGTRCGAASGESEVRNGPLKRVEGEEREGPLDLFERLVRRRSEMRHGLTHQHGETMDMDM